MKYYNMEIGKLTVMGNRARMEQLSASVRKTIASNAAKVRWNKAKHLCEPFCKCLNCNQWMSRHSRYSACKEFVCQTKGASTKQKIPTSTKNI